MQQQVNGQRKYHIHLQPTHNESNLYFKNKFCFSVYRKESTEAKLFYAAHDTTVQVSDVSLCPAHYLSIIAPASDICVNWLIILN